MLASGAIRTNSMLNEYSQISPLKQINAIIIPIDKKEIQESMEYVTDGRYATENYICISITQ